jgi:hypothetical protein
VQNVAEGGDVVTGAEVSFVEVAGGECKTIGKAEAGNGFPGDRQYAWPIDSADVYCG